LSFSNVIGYCDIILLDRSSGRDGGSRRFFDEYFTIYHSTGNGRSRRQGIRRARNRVGLFMRKCLVYVYTYVRVFKSRESGRRQRNRRVYIDKRIKVDYLVVV
jgi:hypothetical protein